MMGHLGACSFSRFPLNYYYQLSNVFLDDGSFGCLLYLGICTSLRVLFQGKVLYERFFMFLLGILWVY